jgi:dipeptidyl aminopeptidase/acylaminoacyl peptidase
MLRSFLTSAAGVALIALICLYAPAASAAPPNAEAFARLPAIDSVAISPDGKHIAAVTSPDGVTTFISIWATDDMSRPPFVIPPSNYKQFRFFSVRFVKNDRIAVRFRQLLDLSDAVDLSSNLRRSHLFRTLLMGIDAKAPPPFRMLETHDPRTEGFYKEIDALNDPPIINLLPRDPRRILVRDTRVNSRGDIVKVDVYTGASERVYHGSDKYEYETDFNGDPRARVYLFSDAKGVFEALELKDPKTQEWAEHFRWYAKTRNVVSLASFTEDPNIVYLLTANGGDKDAVYGYDIAQRKLLDPAFQHKLFEATGVVQSHALSDYGHILGFDYAGDARRIYWTDDKLDSIQQALSKALGAETVSVDWTDPGTGEKARIETGGGFSVDIMGYSNDLDQMIVVKSGPKQPPEYYLLSGGNRLVLLGKSRPQIDPTTLGDTRMVEFAARDGLLIPAFLTSPPKSVYGPGPYPAIVLPHGGPWGRDYMDWDFSGWTQYFAARGYAVIEPQFRGSEGWGQKLWRAGDAEWGQKMQDDDVDAAKWMIAQGIAAPNRIALHGYSYGGYTGFTAGIKPEGVFQCAIAGAGVAEINDFRGETNQTQFEREFQRPTVAGFDPMAHAAEVSVPMLIYHGDRDHTVDISQSRRFVAKLQAAGGKHYKFVEIPDMGHQFVLWTPQDHKLILETIDNFLRTDCKPGGL